MIRRHTTHLSFALVSLLIGAGCGGSDTDSSAVADTAATAGSSSAEPGDEASSDEASSDDEQAGFGELIEGSFIFSGAVDESYYVSDEAIRFQLGGGCQDGAFGFSINIYETATDMPLASFGAQMQQDLSGGATGEFDPVDAEIYLLPGADHSQSIRGPLRMVISEHETGGSSADINARRMTVTLLGALPTDAGDIDVDVTFRWVMACL